MLRVGHRRIAAGLRNVRLVSGTQPTFSSVFTGVLFPGVQRPRLRGGWPRREHRNNGGNTFVGRVLCGLLCRADVPHLATERVSGRWGGDSRSRSYEEVETVFVNGYEIKSTMCIVTEFLNSCQEGEWVHSYAAGLRSKLVITIHAICV